MSARIVRRPRPGSDGARTRGTPARRAENVRLQALNRPRPVDVHSDANGAPSRVRIGRSRIRVEAVRDEWRIDDEWWRNPISREYLELILEDGRVLTVYRDLIEDRWYAQGA